ncbi:MAG: ShlB/FhaC/HecB family hemolysin secretion/activation protein [Alphaproteobacteria bacterium]|nr:ShlB/FhaC/HecB family hemolysin secretion/activation protein [Alphaproteobacteria bacterium]
MKKNLLISAFGLVSVFAVYSTAEAQVTPQGVAGQLGTVQQQDLDSAKRLEMERQGMRDYQNRQAGQEQKAKREAARKVRKTSERAKPSEYKTKGVYIERIEVPASEILTAEEISSITMDYEHANVTMADLNEMLDRINEFYLDKGFVTARAYLPEQTIENGVIKVALLEGKVGDVTIEDTRWTKKSHIKKRLDMNEGEVFNVQKLEENMLIYNRYNNGITLNGDLNPGKKEGTTDITIKAEEEAPYHLIAVADNSGRKTIGKNRAGLIAQHDSLFGYRDKLSAGIYANRYSWTPFVDYNIPVNKYDGRLGVSFSHNEAEIGHGAYKDFNIESRSQNYSLYYTQPLIRKLHKELNSTTSFTYKRAVTSFDGEDLYEDKIPEMKTGLNFRYDTNSGIWYLAQSVSYAAPWFQNRIDYWKFEGSVTRLQDFGHRILGYFRGNYQYIPQDVIPYADQMSAGGFGTVRGYSQGLLTAKSGYQLGAEIYFPIAPETFYINCKPYRTDEYVRPFVFTDYAALYPYKGSGSGAEGFNNSDILLSAGAGLRVQLPYDIVLKAAYGVPLRHNKYETHHGGDWTLELSFAPDFNKFFAK